MRLKKYNFCFVFVLSVFVLLNLLIYFSTQNKKSLQEDYFRIHIVANSNSLTDQKLKYTVAKNVNTYIYNLYKGKKIYTKNTAKELIRNNIYNILNIVSSTIKANNYSYGVIAKIGNITYGKKENSEIQMAKGTYDSVQIVIGSGKGKNFWSLLYPYSYVGNIELDVYAEDKIIDTEYILDNSNNIEYEFGIIRLIKEIFDKNK